jgi:hypothetical protein
MIDWRRIVGGCIGLCVAVAVLALGGRPRAAPPPLEAGPLLSDCDGALRELVIQYVPAAGPSVEGTHRSFLSQLPTDVKVHVVCPGRAAFDDLRRRVGAVACELRPVVTGHEMTAWARDRWLALGPQRPGRAVTLLSPRDEAAAELWPQRAGDARIADDLARALGRRVASARSRVYFDGGDFAADDRRVFVTPAVLRRNLQRTVATADELARELAATLRRRVVLLRDAPDHHAGMFLMPVGDSTVLVGDPGLARELLARRGTLAPGPGLTGVGDDFSDATQQRFDAVAEQCAAAGCRVVRIPVVPGRDHRTYLTYLNAILDERDGRRIVYLPTYAHAPALNEAAATVWQGLGFDVRPVDCTAVYPHFGTLRCLVNVLRRG